jgi:dTDP-4-dehydrorhamnose reductase
LQEVFDVNCYWPAALSGRLKHQGVDFYHISTEYVFGHENGEGPFSELVEPIPSSLYGESKYLGDKGIVDEQGYVIRAALLPDIFPYKVAATNLMASKLRASEACRRIVSYVSGGLPLKSRQSVLHICGVRRSVADFVRDELQAHDVTFQALDDGVTRPLDSSLCSVYSQDKL